MATSKSVHRVPDVFRVGFFIVLGFFLKNSVCYQSLSLRISRMTTCIIKKQFILCNNIFPIKVK